jgi:hypothetical protein
VGPKRPAESHLGEDAQDTYRGIERRQTWRFTPPVAACVFCAFGLNAGSPRPSSASLTVPI